MFSHSIGFPNVLSQTLLSQSLPEMSDIEEQLRQSFAGREDWREGILKTAFNYIIIDPRQLPDDFLERSKRDLELCHKIESFKQFIESIFYVGKGKRSRPYQHLREAITDKVVLFWRAIHCCSLHPLICTLPVILLPVLCRVYGVLYVVIG